MPIFTDKLAAAGVYAGSGLLIMLWLSFAVVRQRVKHQVSLGDGGVAALQQACRAHANASEHLPIGLVALALVALAPGLPLWTVHAPGAALVVGRIAHGLGLLSAPGRSLGRGVGVLLTWLAFLFMALALIAAAISPAP